MKEQDIETLVQYRLEEAQTALEDAEYLLEGQRSSQSIVNRLYYAMFYAVLALLQKMEKVPSKHTGVISLFDTEFVHKGIFSKEMSQILHRAFEQRQASDYKVVKPVSEETIRELLDQTSQFVSEVSAYVETGGQALQSLDE